MLKLQYSLDFSAVTEYDAWLANDRGKAIIIKIEGAGWYSMSVLNPTSDRVLEVIKSGNVVANVAASGAVERLRSAYLDFRTNYCPRAITGVPENSN